MTAEIELAKEHGIRYRLTPEGTTEMWCYDRNVQAFAEAVRNAERDIAVQVIADVLEMGGAHKLHGTRQEDARMLLRFARQRA